MTRRARTAAAPPRFRGHEDLRASLGRALSRGTLPATVLIHGMPGCGKQSLALWLARTRLCTGDPAPCDQCRSCRLALRLEHPDIHWHFSLTRPKGSHSPQRLAELLETARHERLAEFRREPLRAEDGTGVKGIYLAAVLDIRKLAHRRPAMSREQFFVVGNAEHLVPQEASPEAANALLKLLEEPPDGSRFILTSSRAGSLLDTIRSRALPIHLPPLSTSEVAAFLQEECGAEPEPANQAASLSQGSIGAALGYLDADGVASRERDQALALLRTIAGGRRADSYKAALDFRPAGARGLLDLLASLQLWIRDLGAAALGRDDRVVNRGELPFLRETARRLNIVPHRIAHAVSQVEEARMLAQANVNPQLFMASLLLALEDALKPPAAR
ncbi:MAG: hypothetical protein OXF01_17295 [Gemmatimonadetes bacterium]|nr:hypothetical protein [Gemmatimonadota bacterium]